MLNREVEVVATRPLAAPFDTFPHEQVRDGQARHFLLGVLEVFFRRPLALVAPILLLGALGAFFALSADPSYESGGVITTSEDDVLTSLQLGQRTGGYETSAIVTARQINDMISTDRFVDDVIRNAGLTSAYQAKQITRDDVRATIAVEPAGDDLVRVSVVSPFAEQSYRTAAAVLRSFVDWKITTERSTTDVYIDGLLIRLRESEAVLSDLRRERNEFLAANPTVRNVDLDTAVAVQLLGLNDAVTQQSAVVNEDRNAYNEAIAADQSTEEILRQRYLTVDTPELPEEPQPRLRTAVITTFAFAVLGGLVGAGLLVLMSVFDRTVRAPNDIARRFDLDVVAVLPAARF